MKVQQLSELEHSARIEVLEIARRCDVDVRCVRKSEWKRPYLVVVEIESGRQLARAAHWDGILQFLQKFPLRDM